MYQTFHPYSGQKLISNTPSPYAVLGLGMMQRNAFVPTDYNQTDIAPYHSPIRGAPGTSVGSRTGQGLKASLRGLRGLGQIDTNFDLFGGSEAVPVDTYDQSTLPVTSTTNTTLSTTGWLTDSAGNVYNPSNPLNWFIPDQTASGGGTNPSTTSIINSILGDANNIAKIVLTPGGSYSITNPLTGATTSYQGTGQATTGAVLPGLSTSISPATLLIYGGAALVLIMVVGAMGKK